MRKRPERRAFGCCRGASESFDPEGSGRLGHGHVRMDKVAARGEARGRAVRLQPRHHRRRIRARGEVARKIAGGKVATVVRVRRVAEGGHERRQGLWAAVSMAEREEKGEALGRVGWVRELDPGGGWFRGGQREGEEEEEEEEEESGGETAVGGHPRPL